MDFLKKILDFFSQKISFGQKTDDSLNDGYNLIDQLSILEFNDIVAEYKKIKLEAKQEQSSHNGIHFLSIKLFYRRSHLHYIGEKSQ